MAPEEAHAVVLMSIHPVYAAGILSGRKQVEFRRTRLLRPVSHVLLYETSPVGRLTGLFEVDGIEEGDPDVVWQRYAGVAGLDRAAFDAYFSGVQRAVALRVRNPRRLSSPLPLSALAPDVRPPQSLQYVPRGWLQRLEPADQGGHDQAPAATPRRAR